MIRLFEKKRALHGKAPRSRRACHPPVLCLGVSEGQKIWLDRSEACCHTAIFGPSGSGKTEMLLASVFQTMQAGGSVIFVDGAGSRRTFDTLGAMAAALGRSDDFVGFDLAGPHGEQPSDFPTHRIDASSRNMRPHRLAMALIGSELADNSAAMALLRCVDDELASGPGGGEDLFDLDVLRKMAGERVSFPVTAAKSLGALADYLRLIASDTALHGRAVDTARNALCRVEDVVGHLREDGGTAWAGGNRSQIVYLRLPDRTSKGSLRDDAMRLSSAFSSYLDIARCLSDHASWSEKNTDFPEGLSGIYAVDGIDFDERGLTGNSTSQMRGMGLAGMTAFDDAAVPESERGLSRTIANIVQMGGNPLGRSVPSGHFSVSPLPKRHSLADDGLSEMPVFRGRGLFVSSLFPRRPTTLRRGLGWNPRKD